MTCSCRRGGPARKAAHGMDKPECARTLAGVTCLVRAEQLGEISFTVVLPGSWPAALQ
jgi:hypothetical protein